MAPAADRPRARVEAEVTPVEPLPVTVSQRAGWTVVAPRGPLDVANAPALRQRLIEVQLPTSTRVVLDLEQVEFIDSFGLAVVIGAIKRARSTDGAVAVRCTRERTLSLLALTGLAGVLDVVADLAELGELDGGA